MTCENILRVENVQQEASCLIDDNKITEIEHESEYHIVMNEVIPTGTR